MKFLSKGGDKDVDMITFTGSTKVGKKISNLAVMKPLLLELGGKDAAIILEDADLDLAVKECISGCFSYSGQRCTAIKRIIAVGNIGNKFSDKFVKEVEKLKVGKPEDNSNICCLINKKAVDYIQELVDDAKRIARNTFMIDEFLAKEIEKGGIYEEEKNYLSAGFIAGARDLVGHASHGISAGRKEDKT